MLKLAFCFAAILVVFGSAVRLPVRPRPFPSTVRARPFPGSLADEDQYKEFLKWLTRSEVKAILDQDGDGVVDDDLAIAGDAACDREKRVDPGDTISQDYFDDNICLVHGGQPQYLRDFCSDFRPPGSFRYYVLIATPQDLTNLRNDLNSHQNSFQENYYMLPPTISRPDISFYSDRRYLWVECAEQSGQWIATRRPGYYVRYIPRGTSGNAANGTFQIDTACTPVLHKPGFNSSGPC